MRMEQRGKMHSTRVLGAFVKLRKATITYVMASWVRPSIVRMGQVGSHWKNFN
jgi:hypothetical protein